MSAARPVIAVLGAGSWGTALAMRLARNGHEVRLWGLAAEVEALTRDGENRRYLPGIPLPIGLRPVAALAAAVAGADEVLVVTPSHVFHPVLTDLAGCIPTGTGISWATKGLEPGDGRLLSEVAAEVFPDRSFAMVSGPSFAREVAMELPTAVAVASPDEVHARRLAGYLHCDRFRAYTIPDLVGLQVGAAAKNVMAIAAGAADGLGFGANTRAALITRGLAEITRLGCALGGRQETFMGLGGLGDLVLTCTDNQSRNRRMGLLLAEGETVGSARERIGQVVEGVGTAREVWRVAQGRGIDMPITEQVYRVLYEGLSPREAVTRLLERAPRAEAV